jgi:hypothetical protein
MPTKYTYKQVQDIFSQRSCTLVSKSYANQLEKLDYIASCGHNNKLSVKEILVGHGIKCRNCALEIPSYESISSYFESKNCKLCYTKDEFNSYYVNNKQKLNYIASCGHENKVSWQNFKSINQGIYCPKCVNINTGEKLKKFRALEDNKNSCLQEMKCINYFKDLVSEHFNVVKLFDGCKADIAVKKTDDIQDLWLGIQVKSTNKKTERNQYYFRLNNGKYDNCLLLCICEEDKKMWLISYEEVAGLKTIGIAQKSKYNKYEVSTENVIEKLSSYYQLTNKFDFDTLNTPTNKTQRQEHEYRKLRENKIDFIEFINNDVEGLVYDFKIGEKRVQEKVGSIVHDNPNSFLFCLKKYECRIEGKCKSQCYQEGDNDLYWLHCKNGKFYVIPEKELIKYGYIGNKEKLYVSPTNKSTEWCNKYLFDYNNVDKERLLQLINIINV